MRNILVTGIPRSGTTLAAALIDSIPDTVCLSEPQWQFHKDAGGPLEMGNDADGENFARWLVGDVVRLRKKLLAGEPVPDRRTPEGAAVTNYFKTLPDSQKTVSTYKTVEFTRPGLSRDFTLAIKHNGPYLTAFRPILDMDWFTMIAIVRNPLDVLYSWRCLPALPISQGKWHVGARCWPEMKALVKQEMDLLEKQVRIYDLVCQRLHQYRQRIHILPYEIMTTDPDLLCRIIGVSGPVTHKLIEKPKRQLPDEERERILQALRAYGEYYTAFYPDLG